MPPRNSNLSTHSVSAPANSCKKLTKRRLFARRPSGRLGQSTLDGGTPPAGPFYNAEQAACRGLRRRVKPFCNLCDSRWVDQEHGVAGTHKFPLRMISGYRANSTLEF